MRPPGIRALLAPLVTSCAVLAPGVDDVLPQPSSWAARIVPGEPPWGVAERDRPARLVTWWPAVSVAAVGRLPAGQLLMSLSVLPHLAPAADGLADLEVRDPDGRLLWLSPGAMKGAVGERTLSLPATAVALAAHLTVREGRDPRGWAWQQRVASRAAQRLGERLRAVTDTGSWPADAEGWLRSTESHLDIQLGLRELASASPPLPARPAAPR